MDQLDILCAECAAPEGFRNALISTDGLDKVRAALRYDDLSSQLVLALKYADRHESVDAMATLMLSAGEELWQATAGAIFVPVPLHRSRLRQRRFNQAGLLASAISEKTGEGVALDLLTRNRATPQQQGLSAKARIRNVKGAFKVNSKYKETLKGKHIILIDDVLTTGSTLKACARVLKKNGASQVSALVLARVVRDDVIAI